MSKKEETVKEEVKLAVVGDKQVAVDSREDLRKKAKELKDRSEENYWEMAIVLKEIFDNDLYRAWGYESWIEYVDKDLEVGIRTVQMYLQLQRWFETLPSNVQAWIHKMGWTKARCLMKIVTAENAGEWKNRLAGKTVKEIEEILEAARNQPVGGGSSGEGSGGGDGSGSGSAEREKVVPKKFALYPAQLENIERALNRASEITESDKEGHNLDMICLEFLTTNTNLEDKIDYLKQVEKIIGYSLYVYDESKDVVIYGQEFMDRLTAKYEEDEDESEKEDE